jgi:hypothetical protein
MNTDLFTIISTFISETGEAVMVLADSQAIIWEFRGSKGLCAPSQESLEVLYG